jgi:Zn-dependent peptidase ImmA (M78 family)
MDRTAYYQQMKVLARESRAKHGVVTSALGLREMRRVYKAEAIKVDLWPHKMKKIRAAYFIEDDRAYVLLKKNMPVEPRLFSMAHELKHHLVDQDLARTKRLECAADFSSQAEIEIGAEVFAAEFIFPEEEFAAWAEQSIELGACRPENVVTLKRCCPARVSYTFLVKRLERLGFAQRGTLGGVNYVKLEEKLHGPPLYKRILVSRQRRAVVARSR